MRITKRTLSLDLSFLKKKTKKNTVDTYQLASDDASDQNLHCLSIEMQIRANRNDVCLQDKKKGEGNTWT